MTELVVEPPATPEDSTRKRTRGKRVAAGKRSRPRRRVSVVGVLGELLITAGVVVLAFIGWQQWFNNLVVGSQLHSEAVQQSSQWNKAAAPAPTKPVDPAAPPVITADIANAQVFGAMIIPRFGADFYRPIAQGTGTTDVLNKGDVGHYPTTQMPGAVGNFAVASHRTVAGGNFGHLNDLRVGDHIFVETADGWYQYSFRNLQFVKPTGVSVLDPVPDQTGIQPGDRMITMTSCNPLFSAAERIIAYGSFDEFYPRAGGAPTEIAATVAGKS